MLTAGGGHCILKVSCLCVLVDARRVMQESVALDTSHESSRVTTRLPSPEIPADQLSDWDSWEDENEVRNAAAIHPSTSSSRLFLL